MNFTLKNLTLNDETAESSIRKRANSDRLAKDTYEDITLDNYWKEVKSKL